MSYLLRMEIESALLPYYPNIFRMTGSRHPVDRAHVGCPKICLDMTVKTSIVEKITRATAAACLFSTKVFHRSVTIPPTVMLNSQLPHNALGIDGNGLTPPD